MYGTAYGLIISILLLKTLLNDVKEILFIFILLNLLKEESDVKFKWLLSNAFSLRNSIVLFLKCFILNLAA